METAVANSGRCSICEFWHDRWILQWPKLWRPSPLDERPASQRGVFDHIFFGFIEVIFMAFDICIWQPAISFWDIDDFADVISCMAIVLFSPSGIFIIIASAFAMPASEQPVILDFAEAGIATMASAAIKAARVSLEIMFAPQTEKISVIADLDKRARCFEVPLTITSRGRAFYDPADSPASGAKAATYTPRYLTALCLMFVTSASGICDCCAGLSLRCRTIELEVRGQKDIGGVAV
jgi:hypothetical protein